MLRLFKPTREGETEIAILTRRPATVVTAAEVAQIYRERWTVEKLFLTVTMNFPGEIQSLGYPNAALFSHAFAMVAYNILATVRAVLGSVHGVGKIQAGLSDFYLVDEIQGTYRGMMIAIAPPEWSVFQFFSREQLVLVLQDLAARVRLASFLKQPRTPKKKKPPLIVDSRHRHVSTARLLSNQKKSP